MRVVDDGRGSHDPYDPDYHFSKQTVVASAPGCLDSSVAVITYHRSADRQPFVNCDNGVLGSLYALALFNTLAQRETFTHTTYRDLGYARPPAKVTILRDLRIGRGLGETNARAILLVWALRHCCRDTLVVAEFGGADFNSQSGLATSRGVARACGFIETSP